RTLEQKYIGLEKNGLRENVLACRRLAGVQRFRAQETKICASNATLAAPENRFEERVGGGSDTGNQLSPIVAHRVGGQPLAEQTGTPDQALTATPPLQAEGVPASSLARSALGRRQPYQPGTS